ncbi:MAG: phosphotransferase [bacterium]|nr:phosphotransferase [bacterium]
MAFPVTDATARDLLDQEYGISGQVRVSPLPGSVMNPNWVLEVAGSERLVVRCFLRNRNPARLGFQMAFHQTLAGLGFPVPAILANCRGDSLSAHAGFLWAVYAWVDGEEYDYNSQGQLDSAGTLLGTLHAGLAGAEIPGYVEPSGFPRYAEWSERGEDLLRGSLSGTGSSPLPPEDVEFALAVQRWMAGTLGAAGYGTLPKQFVWGDVHGRNLKFRNDQIVGLLDFDVVRWESPAYDVGSAVYMLCRRSRSDLTIRLDAVSRLVQAYARSRPLSAAEARAVLPLLIYRYITDLHVPGPLPLRSDPGAEARKAIRILRALWVVRDELAALLVAESG